MRKSGTGGTGLTDEQIREMVEESMKNPDVQVAMAAYEAWRVADMAQNPMRAVLAAQSLGSVSSNTERFVG